jgi:polysaccharide deacetylase family protein (PEP-CTERM system associated)
MHTTLQRAQASPDLLGQAKATAELRVVLSFDVEEHYQIEAARGLGVNPSLASVYRERLKPSVDWILRELDEANIKATFFVVGELAQRQPGLVKAIARAGHEVASHGWDHEPITRLTPDSFRADVARGKDVLEQIIGAPVVGYRAPTFSILRETSWAIDILADLGMRYDSSIYPVRHDRYGIAAAPRAPFIAQSSSHALIELPPATWRILGMNVPVGGGGSFRLFPLWFMKQGLRQLRNLGGTRVAMLYFHPWEFDPDQPRLPLGRLARFRTYVGIKSSRCRLNKLLANYDFVRAIDVVQGVDADSAAGLARFNVDNSSVPPGPVISIRRANTGEEVTVTPTIA